MTLTQIKKELYKQKPIAIKTDYVGEYKHYQAALSINSKYVIVEFHIPNKEAEFENRIQAQYLIRWIV